MDDDAKSVRDELAVLRREVVALRSEVAELRDYVGEVPGMECGITTFAEWRRGRGASGVDAHEARR